MRKSILPGRQHDQYTQLREVVDAEGGEYSKQEQERSLVET